MEDVWLTQDLPFLKALIQLEAEGDRGEMPFTGDITRRAGLPDDLGPRLVDRLANADYIDATVQRDGAGRIWATHVLAVSEKARRATGMWPSDDPFQRLVNLLDQRIADEADE